LDRVVDDGKSVLATGCSRVRAMFTGQLGAPLDQSQAPLGERRQAEKPGSADLGAENTGPLAALRAP